MKQIFILLTGIALCYSSLGQTTTGEDKLRTQAKDTVDGWKKGCIIGLNFSQASFSNWAAGGQNSMAFNGLVSIFANYKKGKSTWDNQLDVGYGLLQQGKNGKAIKTDDKIDLSSKYGKAASKNWYYAGLVNFKTQMAPGYNYPNDSVVISDLFAPAYLIAALGMDYKPDSHFSAFIAPLTCKTTIVNNTLLANAGAFGVDAAIYDNTGALITQGKRSRNEFGGYVKLVYKNTFFKDESVSLLTKLDLFSNYLHNPQNIDVSWETIIGFKVNKFISATFTAHLLYDNDIDIAVDTNNDGITDAMGPRTQFKEVLAIGIMYKF